MFRVIQTVGFSPSQGFRRYDEYTVVVKSGYASDTAI